MITLADLFTIMRNVARNKKNGTHRSPCEWLIGKSGVGTACCDPYSPQKMMEM